MVTALRRAGATADDWHLDLGVHLHVGAPERLLRNHVRVWLHTKECRSRHSPMQLKGILNHYRDGHCYGCGCLPLHYVPKRRALLPRIGRWALGVMGIRLETPRLIDAGDLTPKDAA